MDAGEIRAQETAALTYLRQVLGERAPDYLALAGEFAEAPLEGEGRTFLFTFDLALGGEPVAGAGGRRRHYVAVGQTEPNYFPAYELNPDEAYSFHLGTRFMLVMGLQKVDSDLEPPGARETLSRVLDNYAGSEPVREISLAALFRTDEAYFAVYRLSIGGRAYYCFGADCPPGFYPLTHHPPQMALRLHLGKSIRAEKTG